MEGRDQIATTTLDTVREFYESLPDEIQAVMEEFATFIRPYEAGGLPRKGASMSDAIASLNTMISQLKSMSERVDVVLKNTPHSDIKEATTHYAICAFRVVIAQAFENAVNLRETYYEQYPSQLELDRKDVQVKVQEFERKSSQLRDDLVKAQDAEDVFMLRRQRFAEQKEKLDADQVRADRIQAQLQSDRTELEKDKGKVAELMRSNMLKGEQLQADAQDLQTEREAMRKIHVETLESLSRQCQEADAEHQNLKQTLHADAQKHESERLVAHQKRESDLAAVHKEHKDNLDRKEATRKAEFDEKHRLLGLDQAKFDAERAKLDHEIRNQEAKRKDFEEMVLAQLKNDRVKLEEGFKEVAAGLEKLEKDKQEARRRMKAQGEEKQASERELSKATKKVEERESIVEARDDFVRKREMAIEGKEEEANARIAQLTRAIKEQENVLEQLAAAQKSLAKVQEDEKTLRRKIQIEAIDWSVKKDALNADKLALKEKEQKHYQKEQEYNVRVNSLSDREDASELRAKRVNESWDLIDHAAVWAMKAREERVAAREIEVREKMRIATDYANQLDEWSARREVELDERKKRLEDQEAGLKKR